MSAEWYKLELWQCEGKQKKRGLSRGLRGEQDKLEDSRTERRRERERERVMIYTWFHARAST